MARRVARQSRLDTGEPEGRLAAAWANYRVLAKPYLSATALSSFATCNVKPFVERVTSALRLDRETFAMRQGSLAHEQVQGALMDHAVASTLTFPQALAGRAFLMEMERPLRHARKRLRGIADVVFAHDGTLHVLELKNTRPPTGPDPVWEAAVRYEHGLQLHFYGVLAHAEFGHRPRLALSHLKGVPKEELLDQLAQDGDAQKGLLDLVDASVPVPSSSKTDAVVHETVKAFRRSERLHVLPTPNHDDPGKCRSFRVRSWCPRRLDAPGRFEPLAANLLPSEG